jgi:hypothetical protein
MSALMSHTTEHWRQRAQEARADAEKQPDPAIKKTLLEIASLYDQLAASVPPMRSTSH